MGSLNSLTIFLQELTSGRGKRSRFDTVMTKDFLLASSHGVVVWKTHDFEPGMASFLKEQPGAWLARSAVRPMLSTVIKALVSLAALSTASRSSGLIVCTLKTRL